MLGLGNSLIGGAALETTPADISGLQIWLKNATGVAVGQWDDQSGFGRHAVNTDADEQAAVSDGGLDFSGADPEDHYIFTEDTTSHLDIGGSNAFTIAAVITREGGAADRNAIIGGDGNASHVTIWSEEQININTTGTGGATSTFSFSTDTWVVNTEFLITITKDTSGNFKFYKNGTEVSPSSTTNPTNTGATFVVKFLGARNPGTTGGSYTFDGKIKEFAVYNAQLTGGNLTSLNSYLTGKFGL